MSRRYRSPTVLVRGPIAVVWAPCEFWEDGKTSHCGVDVFDLIQIDGQWHVSNSMWEACQQHGNERASRRHVERRAPQDDGGLKHLAEYSQGAGKRSPEYDADPGRELHHFA